MNTKLKVKGELHKKQNKNVIFAREQFCIIYSRFLYAFIFRNLHTFSSPPQKTARTLQLLEKLTVKDF